MTRQLVDALLQNRDDHAAWSVYGDELQGAGDPHGALVSLMLAREANPSRKLFDAESAHREKHFAPIYDAAWRRGFPVEVRVNELDELVDILEDPEMRFVEAATLEIEGDDWTEWFAALAKHAPRWRRVQVQASSTEASLAMAPVFAALPALEALQITCSGALDWAGAKAEHLKLLVVKDVSESEGLDELELPALGELRVLGESPAVEDLRGTDLWEQLTRVVVDTDLQPADDGIVSGYSASELDDYDLTAFIVVPQAMSAAALGTIAAKLSGLDQLAVELAQIPWASIQMTAIRVYTDAELMPYALALAIQKQIAPSCVATFAVSPLSDALRAFVIGQSIQRKESYTGSDKVVREVLDIAFGCDPGLDILARILGELAAAKQIRLRGMTAVDLAVDTDPSEPPIAPPDDDDDYDGDMLPDHERDLDSDEYADEGWGVDEVVPIDEPVEQTADFELIESTSELEAVKPTKETPDGTDAWSRLEDVWTEKVADPDDDQNELRFPDPEVVWNAVPDVGSTPAEAICTHCDSRALLRPCGWCGANHCKECMIEDERGQVTCKACMAEITSSQRPDDDDV